MTIKDGKIVIDGFVITESTLHNSISSSSLLGITNKDAIGQSIKSYHLGHDNITWMLESDIACDSCYICANCQTCAGCNNNCYQCTDCVSCQGCTTLCTGCVRCNGYCYGSCDLCVECQGCDGCQNICQTTCQTNCQIRCNNNVCGGGCQATCANGEGCSPCDGVVSNPSQSGCSPCDGNQTCSGGENTDPPPPSLKPVILACYPCDSCAGGAGCRSCQDNRSNAKVCKSGYPGSNADIAEGEEADDFLNDIIANGDDYDDESHDSGTYPPLKNGETRERADNGDLIVNGEDGNKWKETLNDDGSSNREREEGEGDNKKTYNLTINKEGKKTKETKTEIVGGKPKTTETTFNPKTGLPTTITYDDGGKINFDDKGNPINYESPTGEKTPLGPGTSFCK